MLDVTYPTLWLSALNCHRTVFKEKRKKNSIRIGKVHLPETVNSQTFKTSFFSTDNFDKLPNKILCSFGKENRVQSKEI